MSGPADLVRRLTGIPLGSRWRWPVAMAAAAGAAAHVPVIGPHLDEARYMGALFIVLTTACLALAAVVLVSDGRAVYVWAVVTCGSAVVGYAATRIVAFPHLSDDVGNWFEPLGVLAVVAEVAVVVASLNALRRTR